MNQYFSFEFDICQDLRGESKQTYLGDTPPNMPPYSQWGALIYVWTPGAYPGLNLQ